MMVLRVIALTLLLVSCVHKVTAGEVFLDSSGKKALFIEVVEDDIIHIEWGDSAKLATLGQAQSLMLVDREPQGEIKRMRINLIRTATLSLTVDTEKLCIEATDLRRSKPVLLSNICPFSSEESLGFKFSQESFINVYGLGQYHRTNGQVNGDYGGLTRPAGGPMGNAVVNQNGGLVANMQAPIAYFLGQKKSNYALFVDNVRQHNWDFTSSTYQFKAQGGSLSLYLIGGADLPDLRANYLELTGRPPVPDRKMFGLWLKDNNFDSWRDVEAALTLIKRANIPVDGVYLDAQWFGGALADSDQTPVGSMRWDRKSYVPAKQYIAKFKREFGAGVIPMEFPYIGRQSPEYLTLASQGALVRQCPYPCDPVYFKDGLWWGRGAMLDYTNSQGAAFWHKWRRNPLIDAGVSGHWLTMDEPEYYDQYAWYKGYDLGGEVTHAHEDVHNLYSLLWSKSIYEGYQAADSEMRPFILARSGTSGSQRYGAAISTGEMGSRVANLASHLNAQMNMSLSGFDYFSSNIGGASYNSLTGAVSGELFTQWLAASAIVDIPMRTYANALCNCLDGRSENVGHAASNLANIRQRYALTPYYYSLAHRAWRYGDAIVPPMVYHFQDDPGVRTLASQKMVGKDMIVATVVEPGAKEAMVYLPAGEWIDYYQDTRYMSKGEWFGPFPLWVNELYRLPIFVRAGAIIPHLHPKTDWPTTLANDLTSERDEVVDLVVFTHDGEGAFTLYEDDHHTQDYAQGAVVATDTAFSRRSHSAELLLQAGNGSFAGMPAQREMQFTFVLEGQKAKWVTHGDKELTRVRNKADFDAAPSAWYQYKKRVFVKVPDVRYDQPNRVAVHW